MRFSLLSIVGAASLLVINASAQLPLIGVTNTMWRYLATEVDPGEDWKYPMFDDSSWPTGRGLFGNESNYPHPMATPVLGPGMGGPMTAYYRTRFQWAGSVAGVILKGTNFVDDGCIMYLNGLEISRFNMPEGPVNSSTPALLANPEPVALQMRISLNALSNGNPNPLVSGENVIAVEVHQNSGTSSDHVFGLSLQTTPDFPCGIIYHPTSQVATACQTVTFTVVAHFECFNPSYQWFFEQSEPIPGANQSTLTLPEVQLDDIGRYFCQVSSINGTLISQLASLEVLPNTNAPAIRYAYVDSDGFHVNFDRPIQMQGGNNDPLSWRVYRLPNGPDLTVISAQLVNGNEVLLQIAENIEWGSFYAYATLRNVASQCGEGVLPAGTTNPFELLSTILDYTDRLSWRYHDTGIDPGTNWIQPSFDDSGWKSGEQVFASDNAVVNDWLVSSRLELNSTNSNPPQRIPTYLFRVHLSLCGPLVPAVVGRAMHDDGMILYVNGREVFRRGVLDSRFSSFGGSIQDANTTIQQPFFIDPTNFVRGDNVIAVLLKQASSTSGDAVLGLRLDATLIGDPSPISIVYPPQSQTVAEGHTWSMQVVQEAPNSCVDYQWYRNGLPLPGAAEPVLTGVAKPVDAGVYYVELRNPLGSERSSSATLQVEPVTLSYRASWRYQTNSQDATLAGTASPWFAPQFDDSSWPIGEGPFAREMTPSTLTRMPSPIATPLPAPEPSLQTVYFRARATIPEIPAGQTLVLCHTIDDGAAIYIDGQLAHRYNLTNTLPIYSTNAAAMNAPGDFDAQIICTPLTLTPGEHLIAVEVHQANPDQSDVFFGLELRLATPPTDLAIKCNSASNYFLQWTTDPFWDLMQSTQITGPYSRVSGSGTSPYALPSLSTNRFYQLRFHGK